MFTRALEYLQQEVEERKWPAVSALLPSLFLLVEPRPGQGRFLYIRPNCSFRSGRFQRERRSKLRDHAELGAG